jgi:hypothetical protein
MLHYGLVLQHSVVLGPKKGMNCVGYTNSYKTTAILYLTKHHAMRMYGGQEEYLHAFLISALNRGESSASRSGRFTPEERAPQYPLDRGLSGPQTCSERGGEEKK